MATYRERLLELRKNAFLAQELSRIANQRIVENNQIRTILSGIAENARTRFQERLNQIQSRRNQVLSIIDSAPD